MHWNDHDTYMYCTIHSENPRTSTFRATWCDLFHDLKLTTSSNVPTVDRCITEWYASVCVVVLSRFIRENCEYIAELLICRNRYYRYIHTIYRMHQNAWKMFLSIFETYIDAFYSILFIIFMKWSISYIDSVVYGNGSGSTEQVLQGSRINHVIA